MSEAQDSRSQNTEGRSSMASNTDSGQQEVSAWALGGKLEVDVGGGQYVAVPNPEGREPSREEIYQALFAAGHQDRANEVANKAYNDVNGTE